MRRAKSIAILGILIGTGLSLVGWSQEWFAFQISEVAGSGSVVVSGIDAAGAVSAISLGLFATVAVLSLAQALWRAIFLLVSLALSVVGAAMVVEAILNPIPSSVGPLSLASGVVNVETLDALVTSEQASAWTIVATVGFGIVVVASLWGLLTMRSWPLASRRFNRPETLQSKNRQATDAYAQDEAWDSFTQGGDPTRTD
ncbi:MAG: Trp biosynthesis-associated membrane protein [Actinobacteria bacterium]|nr:Trp biosynthesis-associated membrane protein [Actinomycetota bacterium]